MNPLIKFILINDRQLDICFLNHELNLITDPICMKLQSYRYESEQPYVHFWQISFSVPSVCRLDLHTGGLAK